MEKALTIAGFDPSGGAGIQSDLKVFRNFRVYGLSVAASLTAQSSWGVDSVRPVTASFVKRQLSSLLKDVVPGATKTGLLYTEENVAVVARVIRTYGLKNFVVDPVFMSSTGRRLAMRNVPDAIRKRLLPVCDVITPNLHEASILTGMSVKTKAEMEQAARMLNHMGCRNVIITGGHFAGPVAVDLVFDGEMHYLKGARVEGEFHGTGCVFSAAVAALLAKKYGVLESAMLAKRFVKKMLMSSFSTGGKMSLMNI